MIENDMMNTFFEKLIPINYISHYKSLFQKYKKNAVRHFFRLLLHFILFYYSLPCPSPPSFPKKHDFP